MARTKSTPSFPGVPSWAPGIALAVGGLAIYKFLSGGVDVMLKLPDRLDRVEVRADKTEDALKSFGDALKEMTAVQVRLEADRIKREAEAAEDARRRLDDASAQAKVRDEDRQKFWQEQRERDRAALKESLRDAIHEAQPTKRAEGR